MDNLYSLKRNDEEIYDIISKEYNRQNNHIELIASENIVSRAVMEAQGSVLTNKYAEGYSGRRYYGGCEHVDEIEIICIERLKKLFSCEYANVQPHSGSQANMAVFMSLLKPGDTILGMSLDCGGHLTHGCKVTMSGKWFEAVSYGVDEKTGLLDYDNLRDIAKKCQPKLIIAGASTYSQFLDFAKFREIADEVGAYLMADIAHYAGLIAAGIYPSPMKYADIVTSTTHKTLRGPRGGIIMTNNVDYAKKINSAVFPGIQGGPLMHVIAGKAVAFGEANTDDFKEYMKNVVSNTQVMSNILKDNDMEIVSGDTKVHMSVIDLRRYGITGKVLEKSLEDVGIVCNKNTIPYDPEKPSITSGIRIGGAACATRGFGKEEFTSVAHLILEVIQGLSKGHDYVDQVKKKVLNLTSKFPIYDNR